MDIFQFLYNLSQKLKAIRFGWLILGSFMGKWLMLYLLLKLGLTSSFVCCVCFDSWLIVVTSFPPLVGYSTSVSVCGFAYGLEGYYVAGAATLIGSGLAFIVLRFLFKRQVGKWTSKNEKWQALEQVIVSPYVWAMP
jgi:golgi apparatus membrane protein TVP38